MYCIWYFLIHLQTCGFRIALESQLSCGAVNELESWWCQEDSYGALDQRESWKCKVDSSGSANQRESWECQDDFAGFMNQLIHGSVRCKTMQWLNRWCHDDLWSCELTWIMVVSKWFFWSKVADLNHGGVWMVLVEQWTNLNHGGVRMALVPDKEAGSCLDPELPGTGLQTEGGEGPGPPYSGEKSQLEPSKGGGKMRRSGGESIPDVMKEDQQPTEWEDSYHW